jgi:hypothetical protein
MIPAAALVLALGAASAAAPPDCPPTPARAVTSGVLVSRDDPAIQIRVDPSLPYVGAFRFPLKGIACVERHVFAAVDGGRIRRLFIVQFEAILGESDEIYRWQVRTPEMLGGIPYQHDVFFADTSAEIREEPGAEPARTKLFLDSRGLKIDDEVMTSRFARVVGDERRHELIFFYTEPLAPTGLRVSEFPGGGARTDAQKEIARALSERSKSAFSVAP